MKRIWLAVLALAALIALSGVAASSALAEEAEDCLRVADEGGTSLFQKPNCTESSTNGGYIRVKIPPGGLISNRHGIACAKTVVAGSGVWEDSGCSIPGGTKNWIRVFEHPAWFINGVQLKQGATQSKLQLKGTAVLKSEITGVGPVTIECKGGVSEGSTIEGYGYHQGQAKGRIAFTSCKSNVCTPAEPIVTKQTKAHLVTLSGHQSKYALLFEPTEGEVFTTLKLGGVCGTLNVTGSVAAEVLPGNENEVQEGELVFPETPITSVIHEQAEIKPKLALGPKEAKFGAAMGARLEGSEPFGVFGG